MPSLHGWRWEESKIMIENPDYESWTALFFIKINLLTGDESIRSEKI